jgi:serine/threonine protein kinase
MARELREEFKTQDGNYHLSQKTGTMRYMAPEVWLGKPYNSSCDVYSFAILLWEMLALEIPFHSFKSGDSFINNVFEGDTRPQIKKKWPGWLKDLLTACWSDDANSRSTMYTITQILRSGVAFKRGGGYSSSSFSKRRSTFVFKRSLNKSQDDVML